MARSVALRLLIHYIGDIHQPLHAITKVNGEFPTSDHIGTAFKLDGENTLHSLWDEAVDQYKGEKVALPLTDHGFNRLGTEAARLVANFKCATNCNFHSLDARAWGTESFHIGKNAYHGIVKGHKPTDEYLQIHQKKANEHIVTGGIRLANTLIHIFTYVNNDLLEASTQEAIFLA